MSGEKRKAGKRKAETAQTETANAQHPALKAQFHQTETGGEFLTKRELAARLKVTVRTVENWHLKGLFPHSRIAKTVRFYWPDVVAQLNGKFATQASGAVRARWGVGKEAESQMTDNGPQTTGPMQRSEVGGQHAERNRHLTPALSPIEAERVSKRKGGGR